MTMCGYDADGSGTPAGRWEASQCHISTAHRAWKLSQHLVKSVTCFICLIFTF